MNNEELVKLATEAYVYGYPMVYTIEEQIKHAEGGYPGTRPVNVMGFADKLLDPEADFVSPNNFVRAQHTAERHLDAGHRVTDVLATPQHRPKSLLA